jgi:hypothetical protein
MSALTIFKQAGINPLVKKADFHQYLDPALWGAGIGGTGMGAASLFGGPKDETGGQKFRRVVGDTLTGAGLGAGVGLGVGAYNSEVGREPDALKNNPFYQHAKTMGQPALDRFRQVGGDKPYGIAHSTEALLHNYLFNPVYTGLTGAGINIGHQYYGIENKMKDLYAKAKEEAGKLGRSPSQIDTHNELALEANKNLRNPGDWPQFFANHPAVQAINDRNNPAVQAGGSVYQNVRSEYDNLTQHQGAVKKIIDTLKQQPATSNPELIAKHMADNAAPNDAIRRRIVQEISQRNSNLSGPQLREIGEATGLNASGLRGAGLHGLWERGMRSLDHHSRNIPFFNELGKKIDTVSNYGRKAGIGGGAGAGLGLGLQSVTDWLNNRNRPEDALGSWDFQGGGNKYNKLITPPTPPPVTEPQTPFKWPSTGGGF